jgi:hypothetical protein
MLKAEFIRPTSRAPHRVDARWECASLSADAGW